MTSVIPGYEYDIFISYGLKKEGEMGGIGEGENNVRKFFQS